MRTSEHVTNGANGRIPSLGQLSPRAGLEPPVKKRRRRKVVDEVRVARYYQRHGRGPTLQYYGISDNQLYPILHREGIKLSGAGNKLTSRKAAAKRRSAARGSGDRGIPAPPAKRQGRKPAQAGRGSRLGDAVTYARHARDRARKLGEAGETIVGLLGLCLESLGAE